MQMKPLEKRIKTEDDLLREQAPTTFDRTKYIKLFGILVPKKECRTEKIHLSSESVTITFYPKKYTEEVYREMKITR